MKELRRDFATKRFWRHFAKNTFAGFGALAVLVSVFAVFYPSEFIENRGRLTWAFVLLSLGFGIYKSWPRPIKTVYSTPNTSIRLVKGDIFNQDCNLVIGMTDTFDTSIPEVIEPSSLQGQFLTKLYGGDVDRLDNDISAALHAMNAATVGTVAKAKGKSDQYPLGTTVVLQPLTHKYFLLAYTEMDSKNNARATTDGIWKCLSDLWATVREKANGDPIAITVLGGGQSRIAQVLAAQNSIRFIAFSFFLASRREKVCEELRIVVQAGEYEGIDRLEIQSFLDSLRDS